MIILLMILI